MTSDNAGRLHFADFTTENYRRLVRLASTRYPICTFADLPREGRFALWRHDVDFSPQAARRIARVEAEEGVSATYFLLLHSQFYNLLEQEATRCVRDIAALGHQIGLHFDAAYYGIEHEHDLELHLQFEKELLERLFGQAINAFSFHITTPFTLGCQRERYAGMLNVYGPRFQTEIGYCSDSNGYWRFRRLEDVLVAAAEPRLQILTHPEMWQDEIMSPRQRVERCIIGRAAATRRWYDDTLASHGRENVDW